MFYAIIMGTLNGDEQLIREGAMATCYYSWIHWAHRQGYEAVDCWGCLSPGAKGVLCYHHGYEAVDFWGSRPYMMDLFSYKRKWGATVGVSPDMPQRIWLRIRHNTPAVCQFLKDNPCITLDDKGRLWGLVVADDLNNIDPGTKASWRKQYDTPGLNGLLIRSVSDLSSPNG